MTDTTWTPEAVALRFAEASRSLRASKSVSRGPAKELSAWPQAPHDPSQAYGYTSAEAPRLQPGADEIMRMDEVLDWVRKWLSRACCEAAGLPPDAGWIAWTHAAGLSWARISAMLAAIWGASQKGGGRSTTTPGGNSHTALQRHARGACSMVASNLNKLGIPCAQTGEPGGKDVAPGRFVTMGRVMEHWARSEQPCGTCARFVPHAGRGGACTKYLEAVSPLTHAQHPVGQPCWVQRGKAA